MKRSDWDGVADKLKAMEPGDEFFLPFRRSKDVRYLHNLAAKVDVKITLRNIELDPVEGKPGVRVTRLASAPIDPATSPE